MKLIGIISIVTRKDQKRFMKLCFLDDSERTGKLGCDVSTEFVPFDENLLSLLNHQVEVKYYKGINGKAYANGLIDLGE